MATIRDVARKAGVSVATVSYVINEGTRTVAPATRARVLQAMQALNYHPNASARQLAKQRSGAIGVVLAGLQCISNFADAYFLGYIHGISYAAELYGYNVVLLTNYQGVDKLTFLRQTIRSRLVDGFLLIGSSIPDEVIVSLHREKCPAVLIARRVPGHTVCSVQQDYFQGAYEATHHLTERGYRRIGFLGQALNFSYALERLQGYQKALSETGLPYEAALVKIPMQSRDDPALEEVSALLAAGADALITDREIAVLNHLRALGVQVGDEVALVGLDESEAAAALDVPLTTLRPPKFELGRRAVEMLLDLIEGRMPEPPEATLPMELIVRRSSPPRPAMR
ncbi:MAG: LacI family transcriptional regulator [Caldilinea sp.]|nr:LacI family transcriptional regulator [Caldilinea sp.]MDW8441150.1 LacI family DNA-binding transcriptional regulator [Caldilineaceae bacterium]